MNHYHRQCADSKARFAEKVAQEAAREADCLICGCPTYLEEPCCSCGAQVPLCIDCEGAGHAIACNPCADATEHLPRGDSY